jgi:TolB-like protein/class 3 adenylate cyclase/Tfp pilus assembly protein PilF
MAPQNRQLAAIMFTDIEGYSAIMQRNEEKAIFLKNRHREILNNQHEQFNGRIIQYYGDGTLSIFHSAVEAVKCAFEMQKAFRSDPVVPVRIGLHVGDIVFDDNQIFGDGVNLASRIESLSVPGAVLLSDRINDQVNNHPDVKTISLGIYQLKNIERSVEVFALDRDGLVIPSYNSLEGKTRTTKKLRTNKRDHADFNKSLTSNSSNSIAVMPFLNMSNDPDQDYFGEGVAEEILNSLSSLKQLKVAGRASSFQFNGKNAALREIGEKLGVRTVLEGSIRKQSNRVRVTVQLINIEDGFQMWSERYDRNMDDIFAIQDEIALSITEKLKVTLLENDRQKITKTITHNTEAYELYLKGRFYINRRGAAILTGIKYFQLAIELDSGFALAFAGFADANLMAAFYGLWPPKESGIAAKKAAEMAIRLNPALCEPYCSLGYYYNCCEWDWIKAEKYYLKSIKLNPSYAQAHYWYGLNFLSWAMGNFSKAEKHGNIALRIDPLSAVVYGVYGPILHVQGKFEETIAICRKGIELDPYAFTCRLYEGWANLFLNRYESAIEIFEKIMKISNNHPFAQGAITICYILSGDLERAHSLFDDLKQRSQNEFIAPAVIGLGAAYMGDLDEAFEYLEKAYDDRDPMMMTLKYEHWIPAQLKEDIRFQLLLDKIGFPEQVMEKQLK